MNSSVCRSAIAVGVFVLLVLLTPCPAQTTDDPPQETVECAGWHALCSLATDCKVKAAATGGTAANCDCWRITEQHLVMTRDLPLSCQCTLHSSRYVGSDNRCSAVPGTVMSAIRIESRDFDNNTFSFSVPGDDYVKEACAAITSGSQ